jgi:hypothetical protein
VTGEEGGGGARLAHTDRAQGNVCLALDAAFGVPFGFTVAYQAQACDGHDCGSGLK